MIYFLSCAPRWGTGVFPLYASNSVDFEVGLSTKAAGNGFTELGSKELGIGSGDLDEPGTKTQKGTRFLFDERSLVPLIAGLYGPDVLVAVLVPAAVSRSQGDDEQPDATDEGNQAQENRPP